MQEYFKALEKCVLFNNIDKDNYEKFLECIDAHIKHYREEEYIFFSGDEVNYVGVVLSGVLEILKESMSGNKHIVAMVKESDMFGEGIVCTAKRISPVTVQANEDSVVLFIPYERIIKACGNSCSYHFDMIQNMMVILGEKNLHLNKKLEILTLKGMREKLAAFLINEVKEEEAYTFQVFLNRTEMADYLNVSRTSMCRELSRMKEEGLIDYYGRSFKILNKEELARCLE